MIHYIVYVYYCILRTDIHTVHRLVVYTSSHHHRRHYQVTNIIRRRKRRKERVDNMWENVVRGDPGLD